MVRDVDALMSTFTLTVSGEDQRLPSGVYLDLLLQLAALPATQPTKCRVCDAGLRSTTSREEFDRLERPGVKRVDIIPDCSHLLFSFTQLYTTGTTMSPIATR